MGRRLRHCVECPECHTRYLIGFSPYSNGSLLVSISPEASPEYKLTCTCRRGSVCSKWRRNELKVYEVPREAYARGYGPASEICLPPSYSNLDEKLGELQ
jgi:hypothetical protein